MIVCIVHSFWLFTHFLGKLLRDEQARAGGADAGDHLVAAVRELAKSSARMLIVRDLKQPSFRAELRRGLKDGYEPLPDEAWEEYERALVTLADFHFPIVQGASFHVGSEVPVGPSMLSLEGLLPSGRDIIATFARAWMQPEGHVAGARLHIATGSKSLAFLANEAQGIDLVRESKSRWIVETEASIAEWIKDHGRADKLGEVQALARLDDIGITTAKALVCGGTLRRAKYSGFGSAERVVQFAAGRDLMDGVSAPQMAALKKAAENGGEGILRALAVCHVRDDAFIEPADIALMRSAAGNDKTLAEPVMTPGKGQDAAARAVAAAPTSQDVVPTSAGPSPSGASAASAPEGAADGAPKMPAAPSSQPRVAEAVVVLDEAAADSSSKPGLASAPMVLRSNDDAGLAMVVSPEQALQRLRDLQDFVKSSMIAGVDFGVIPGTQKPTLLQPGAQKLAELYGFSYTFQDERPPIEKWEGDPPFFAYFKRVILTRRRDGLYLGCGIGSCNSRETKYAGRWVFDREVPAHLDPSKLRTREFRRKNGGGGSFLKYLIPNEDIASCVNTIEKMACKRSLVHGVIGVTRSSGLFTQDAEDLPPEALGRKYEEDQRDDAELLDRLQNQVEQLLGSGLAYEEADRRLIAWMKANRVPQRPGTEARDDLYSRFAKTEQPAQTGEAA